MSGHAQLHILSDALLKLVGIYEDSQDDASPHRPGWLREAINIAEEASLSSPQTPAQEFADWISDGPRLAKAAGVYVGITVRPLPISTPNTTLDEQERGDAA
jgi:hypothetical protein